MPEKLPSGKIVTAQQLGEMVKAYRKENAVTQKEFAALAGVGNRFLSELENGKTTAQLGKILQVLAHLGLEMHIKQRRW